MLRSRSGIRVGLFFISACSTVANEPAPEPSAALSEPVFRCNVEPILARQCSYNACHGNAGSALRVYTPGKLRAAVPADIDAAIAPLTEAEHHANFESAAGFNFGVDAVDDNLLLRKPLPANDGGFSHLGGAIFNGKTDAEYMTILTWLDGRGACR